MNSSDTGSLMQRLRIVSMSLLLASAIDLADRIEVSRAPGAPQRDFIRLGRAVYRLSDLHQLIRQGGYANRGGQHAS